MDAHDKVDALLTGPTRNDGYRRALAHAFIDLGRPLACMMPHCSVPEGREHFEPTGAKRLSFDHDVPRAEGGTDRTDNMRFAHLCCNFAHAKLGKTKLPPPPERFPDEFELLSPGQQALIRQEHDVEPAPTSRWRFDQGYATLVTTEGGS